MQHSLVLFVGRKTYHTFAVRSSYIPLPIFAAQNFRSSQFIRWVTKVLYNAVMLKGSPFD